MNNGILAADGTSAGSAVASDEVSSSTWQALEFRGTTDEYFKIWIVNITLSILTLGIYSAWATVRNRRYFYGNTFLDGSHFDFHGNPIAILKGRIIATLLLAAWVGGDYLHPFVPLGAFLILVLLLPWLIVRGLCFRYRNTSFRNLRFDFTGRIATAYKIMLIYLVAALATIALFAGIGMYYEARGFRAEYAGVTFLISLIWAVLYAWLMYHYTTFKISHTRFGDAYFDPDFERGAFVRFVWGMILCGLVIGICLLIIISILGYIGWQAIQWLNPEISQASSMSYGMFFAVLLYVLLGIAYLFPYAYWQVNLNNYIFNNTRLDTVQFRSKLEVNRYWFILVTNAFAAIFSLGLAIPWTKIRMARYRVEQVAYQGDFNEFTGRMRNDQAALGEEVGEAFDLDFGI